MPISQRAAAIQPQTYQAKDRSALALLATEDAIYSTDSVTKKPILEVWRADGMEPVDQVPLCDAHEKGSVADVLGSVSDVVVKGREVFGTVRISATEEKTATKVEEGHIRDVSCGIEPREVVVIRQGQTAEVGGEKYTAPNDSDLRIVTRWRLREVSLCPIGADPSAKIRSLTTKGEGCMTEKMRAYLRGIGMDEKATEEEERAFYDSLPERARQRADEAAKEEDRGADEPDGDEPKKEEGGESAKASGAPLVTRQATPRKQRSTVDAAEIAKSERARIADIQRLGDGLPAETVRKAVDEGWTKEQAAVAFLELQRGGRSAPVLPGSIAIHSRSREVDCTAETLGLGLAIRSVGGDKLYARNASYESAGGGEYRLRRHSDVEGYKRRMGELLERSHEYSSMSLVDICREACRIDGKPASLRTPPEEVFRTAVSGSALASIFTTNINAEFLTGYMDYADSTTEWCSTSDVANFLTAERATMGKFGSLQRLQRGATADDLNTSDWKESYKIARYAGKFTVDEQDIINDRFGALEQESPKDMGLSAAQLRPNLVYSEVLNNAALDVDGVALFHSTHANYGTTSTALDVTPLQAALAAMAKQRINGRVLNLQPRFLIVPQDLRWTAEILLKSQQRIISASSGGTYNPLENLLTPISDDRIGVAGVVDPRTGTAVAGTATNWMLACRPGEMGAKTIEVGYLRGTGRAPAVRSYVLDRGQWGLGWDVKFDIGVKALDYRAMYFASGAGS